MYDNNTQIPRQSQPHPDYVRSTRLYALDLGLVGEQIEEFLNVDRRLDWYAAKPERINRWPLAYKMLKDRYEQLTAPKNIQN